MRLDRRNVIAAIIAYGPAVVWVVLAIRRYGRSWPVVGLVLMVAAGIFGLTGVFLAWFPWAVERLGWKRFGAWLRTWWDEDAKA